MKSALFILPFALVPFFANDFWLVQIFGRALILGVIALSLTFLAAYLGVVSFAQATMAGVSGYTVAYFGPNSVDVGRELPFYVVLPLAIIMATLSGVIIGLIARRSQGIYAIMITLAVGVAFFYFTRQNYTYFNGWTGFSGIRAPEIAGTNLRDPLPFYLLIISVAMLCLMLVNGFIKSPLGLTIQAVRDAPKRVLAIGIPTTPVIVSAYAIAGFIAGSGGILNVWYQERISSFSVGLGPIVDILVIAVIGGLKHPIGAFIGALAFVLLDTFAVDFIDRERFNTLIGLVLLAIIMGAPDGLHGLAKSWLARFKKRVAENQV
ncbi:branched-chain amino acid ABC transporter permease [Shimia sagamensis]|uniref:Amino acid/amide ABC transporter membrane protein 2, HAAT family n=1 Tax=Shimia sagamensis TaxID=1566352 RepID=A0ABY1PJB4_9RHOB|nr:branched-chain amino acid ABC transporter permease [Shimia sagamensis]SMP35502.1 amino acid/amide ABC transporter membrane protein 2, HAAT family [Shimia sagamensis]